MTSNYPPDTTLRFDGAVIEAIIAHDAAGGPSLAEAIERVSPLPGAPDAVVALLAEHGIACELIYQPDIPLPLIVLTGPPAVTRLPGPNRAERRRAARAAHRRGR